MSGLKNLIHFKHVFLIGEADDFQTEEFLSFLKGIVNEEMKPFCLYMHRLKAELVASEYPHLIILQNQKRKLPLYP